MISKKILDFLTELEKNNNRDWFSKNKPRYEEARAEFENFISNLILEIAKFDKQIIGIDAKKSVFRIYKDTRFSKDKTPYKTNFGAHLIKAGSKGVHSRAGYYIHIEPNKCFLAGGAYMPESNWLKAIRKEIYYNSKEFKKIINNSDFKRYFEIEGEKLSKAPQGYSPDHPEIELLKYKSMLAVHNLSDEQILSKDFLSHSAKVFKVLYPFDKFLNKAMD
ncbi:MAG: DUF2461 domain-containing protein [Ignavibacteriae bacterium]|nr:DUF2461 domain-containing protein [Ignavibacteriota bacterium]